VPSGKDSGARRAAATSGSFTPQQAVLAAGVLVFLAGAAAYANSFHGPFVFDDVTSIQDNPTIRHLWPPGPVLFGARAATVIGRPVLNLSFALNYALCEMEVWGYHAVNLLVHLAAGLVLFGIVRRTLLLESAPERFRSASTGLALAVALLWAVHPLQTESVTYVVQRAESMAGLFYLLTLYAMIRGATSPRGTGWYIASVAACLLGMGTKEVVATAPLLVLLYDHVFLAGSIREALRRRWGLYAGLAAAWGVLAALVATSVGRGETAGFGHGVTAGDYARTQFGFLVRYLRLSFWPEPLVFDYGMDTARTVAEVLPYAVIVAALLAGTVLVFRRRPQLGFLGAWFFLILAPTSSVVPLVTQIGAEHRMYLPLAAVVTLVVVLAYEGWGRVLPRLSPAQRDRPWAGRFAPAAALAVVATALGLLTVARNRDYRSSLSIWEDTAAKRPANARAHCSLGLARFNSGDADVARVLYEYDLALELDPDYALAYANRGGTYQSLGQHEQAIRDYTKAIELLPRWPDAYCNRAVAYVSAGQYEQALADCSRAVELKPDSAQAYFVRGLAHQHKGLPDPSIQDFTRAIELEPLHASAYAGRGMGYQAKGLLDQAVKDYTKAINLAPHEPTVYHNRAVCYWQMKDYDRAWADVKTCRQSGGKVHPGFLKDLTAASGRSE